MTTEQERHLSADYFDWQGLHIRQDDGVHKIGTDAVLLGAWVPTILHKVDSILDVGTGTGILALKMALTYAPSRIRAIDIDPNAIVLTIENVAYAGMEEDISVREENILDIPTDHERFDCIISNPPYHPGHLTPKDEQKRLAKHLDASVAHWVNGMLARMEMNGHLIIIVPAVSASTWIESANTRGYFCVDRLDVYSFPEDPFPVRSLLHLSKPLMKPTFNKVVIYQYGKAYTTDYLQLTGINQSSKANK